MPRKALGSPAQYVVERATVTADDAQVRKVIGRLETGRDNEHIDGALDAVHVDYSRLGDPCDSTRNSLTLSRLRAG